MIKAVIFDLDNTLVDFMKMKRRAVDAAVVAMIDAGLELTPEEVKTKIEKIYDEQGIEYQKVFNLFLQQELGKVEHRILAPGVVAYRRAREAALTPYPHVYSTLTQLLKQGLKLGILSDAPQHEAWLRLAYLNFHNFFEEVVTFEETGERKPNPLPFKTILDRLNIVPSEAMMVGDWEDRDIIGARNIGMKTAFAKYGDVFETKEHSADYELKDIKDLIDIIKQINSL